MCGDILPGAQFVHRYVTFMPDTRVDRAVSANAGWYTLPDVDVAYPYGLKNTDVATTSRVASLFARKLIVHLGTADTDRNGLNTSAGAEAQGANPGISVVSIIFQRRSVSVPKTVVH